MSLPRLSPLFPIRKVQLKTRQLVLRLSDTTFIAARNVQIRVEQLTPRANDREQTLLLRQMRTLLMSDSPVVRRAGVEALGRIRTSQPAVLEFIRLEIMRAVSDEDRGVRYEAEQLHKFFKKSESLSRKT